MKILKCHIENFGKLKDLTIDFTNNPHVIHENNGWGKSTLAIFIKVMFYGFANEGKRSEFENERKKYKPWQGGVYGGKISFEADEKTYEFTRTFGTKEKEDTYTLFDMKTNLPSKDYSSNIGEELFKIDRESFSRTIFIAQNDIVTNTTDGINAKIGNLVDNTDDINNYETVQEKFKKLLNNMSPTRSTGLIKKKKEEISRLKNNVNRGIDIDRTIKEIEAKLEERRAEKSELKQEQSTIQKQMEQVSSYKDLQNSKETYERICLEYAQASHLLSEQQRYFPAGVPTEKEVQDILEEADRLAGYQGELQSLKLTDSQSHSKTELEQLFCEGIPAAEDLDSCREKMKEYSNLCLKIAELKLNAEEEEILSQLEKRFANQIPDESLLSQYISLWNNRIEIKSRLGANKAALEPLTTMYESASANEESKKTPDKRGGMIPMLAGILAFFIGLSGIMGNLFPSLAGVIFCSAGLVLIIASLLIKSKSIPGHQIAQGYKPQESERLKTLENQITEDEKEIERVETDIRKFFAQYGIAYVERDILSELYELKKQIHDYKDLLNRKQRYREKGLETKAQMLENSVREFLQRYYPENEILPDNYANWIQMLEDNIAEYNRLKAQVQKYKNIQLKYDSAHKNIIHFITEYQFIPAANLTAQLREIQDHIRSLSAAKNKCKDKQTEKVNFENEKDVKRYKELDSVDLPPLEELNERFGTISSELDIIDQEIIAYNRQLDDRTEERDKISEDEEQLDILNKEIQEDLHQYEILLKTKEYLEKAKGNFTARYIGPVMDGFSKYYRILTDESAAAYQIDANINITSKEYGEQRNPKLLSTGYQDLLGLCIRMALVDAMFKEEKPFIIIDDSLVNLDNDKVRGGLKFLSEVAKEYQVIYFTCHASRV